jgi:hypothetical protein
MKTLKISNPGFSAPTRTSTGFGKGRSTAPARNLESTMATVLMTRLHDSKLENRFHRLMVLGEDQKVASTYPLNRKTTTVGRSHSNHIQIKDPLVSVKHLTISLSDDACVVTDLDSSNGTLINGQRLSGVQIMKDGDEIMIGKTVMRFASRHSDAPQPVGAGHRTPFLHKRFYLATAAICCLAAAVAFVFLAFPNDLQRLASRAFASIEESLQFSPPVSKQHAAAPQSPVAAAGADEMNRSARSDASFYIRKALADYAAGSLGSAINTMKLLATAKEQTTEGFQAERMLAMLQDLRDLHARALQAQEQKKFAEAIESWDSLLALDMELVGDRPSYFAIQAEQRVQALSYEFALDAFRRHNTEKARQLCQVILQIDPKNQQALALLAKIDSKA